MTTTQHISKLAFCFFVWLGVGVLHAAQESAGTTDFQPLELEPATGSLSEEEVLSSGLLSGGSLDREGAAAMFEAARKQYDSANYDSAVYLYEGILADGYNDFALHYNLGNAHYKNRATAPAILHYERAARLAPGDPNVQHNLDLARLRQQDKRIEPLPRHIFHRFWRGWTGIFSQAGWALLSMGSAWLLLSGLALLWWSASLFWRRGGLGLVLMAVLLLGFSLSGGFGRKKFDQRDRAVIIMAPSAVLKSAPNTESTDLYILREGFKLQLLAYEEDWSEVSLPDGNTGWIVSEAVEEI